MVLFTFIPLSAQSFLTKRETKEITKISKKEVGVTEEIVISKVDYILNSTASFSRLLNNQAGTMFSDIINDSLFNGIITFSGALTTAQNDTIKDIQTFLASGGNISMRAAFPLHKTVEKQVNFQGFFYPKISLNIPKLGESATNLTGSLDLGFEAHGNVYTNKSVFGFVGRLRGAISGGTKNLTKEITNDGKAFFGYGLLSVGIVIVDKFLITHTIPFGLYNLDNMSNSLSNSFSVNVLF